MYINKITKMEAEVRTPVCPSKIVTAIGELNNPDSAQQDAWYESQGWLLISTKEEAPVGFRASGWDIIDNNDGTASLIMKLPLINLDEERKAAEEEARKAYILDLQVNAYRYALENAYIMLCDMLRGDESHVLMGGTEFAIRMSTLFKTDESTGNKLMRSFSFIKSQLDPVDIRWAEIAQYRDVPEIIAQAQQMIGLLT